MDVVVFLQLHRGEAIFMAVCVCVCVACRCRLCSGVHLVSAKVFVCLLVILINFVCIFSGSSRSPARQERTADRERDSRPLPEVAGDLPVAAHLLGAGGTAEDLR